MNTQNAIAPAPACALPFHKAAYELREITPTVSLVGKFMKLHHEVLQNLPLHGKHWVKRRHFSSVEKHLKEGHIGLCAFAGNQMVGQVLLTFPDLEGGQNLKGYPIGAGQFAPADCMIIQTLGVAKTHQGQGIRKLLLQQAEEIAKRLGRTHIVAKTDVANTGSLSGFETMGYAKSAETFVAGDPYKCVFVHKKVTPTVFAFKPASQTKYASLSA